MTTSPTPQPWTVGRTYRPGDIATFDGVLYQAIQTETAIATWAPPLVAALWTPVPTGNTAPVPTPAPAPVPAPVPAPAGSAPAWSAQSIYTAGMTASEAGLIYRANWWTQGNDPATASGPAGSGQPWTLAGPASL